MKATELVFNNQYGETLYGHKWVINDPKEALVIVTGMAEHSMRYDKFAKAMNKEGYIVFCLDHYGHGKNGELGRVCKDYFFKEIENIHEFIGKIKDNYKIEVSIFSHSMGSFVTQGFIEKYSKDIKSVVICGTNGRNPAVGAGVILSSLMVNKKNENKDAKLLHNLALGAYEKSVKEGEDKNAWISYNKENVERYVADPLSGFRCSNGFFKEFMRGLNSIQKDKNIKNISHDLKILITAGSDDPVGNYGKGPTSLAKIYEKNGLKPELKIYQGLRHEILNESCGDDVIKDLIAFYNK